MYFPKKQGFEIEYIGINSEDLSLFQNFCLIYYFFHVKCGFLGK